MCSDDWLTFACSATGVATAGAGTATAIGTGDSATTVTSTSTATGSPNGALGLSTYTMTTPLMSGLTSVFASMLLGAFVAVL